MPLPPLCTTSTAPAGSCLILLRLLTLRALCHRNDTDALVGYAEANAELARLARRHGGDGAQVSEHLQQALGAYNNALRQSSKLGRLEDRWGPLPGGGGVGWEWVGSDAAGLASY